MLQKEGFGLLPACLSVRLLLSLCLQTHASIPVKPAKWEVCRAGSWSLPVFWSGAAFHHPDQTKLLQEQLELRWYSLVTKGWTVNVLVEHFKVQNSFFLPCLVYRGYRRGCGAWGLCAGPEWADLHGHGVFPVPGEAGHGPTHRCPGYRLYPLCLLLHGWWAPQQGEHTKADLNIL